MRPTLRQTTIHHDRARLAVVLDHSRSMRTRDVDAGRGGALVSREEALRTALRETADRWDRLSEKYDVEYYSFADRAVRMTEPRVAADGDFTSISAALREPTEGTAAETTPLAAVVLFSDGADNLSDAAAPLDAARTLAAGGTLLMTVGVGSEQPRGDTRAIVVQSLTAPRRASFGSRIKAEAVLDCRGLAGEFVQFSWQWDDRTFAEDTVEPASARTLERVTHEFEAAPSGFHVLTIVAKPLDGPWAVGPAKLSTSVHVIDESLPILLVESKPRSESAFVLRALAGESRFRIERVLLGKPVDGTWTNPLPRDVAGWSRYSLVMLGDVSPRDMTSRQLEALRDAVLEGGVGLVWAMGVSSGEPNGLVMTAVRDVVPVAAPQRGPTASRPFEPPLSLTPTPEGLRHPIFQVGTTTGESPTALAAAWSALPTLSGAATTGEPKPAAEVLATGGPQTPLVIAATVGRGRSVVIAFDTSWRWCLHSDAARALHRRFWRQVALWTANRQPRVHVTTDRPDYEMALLRSGAQKVRIEAFATDPVTQRPLPAARLQCEVRGPAGQPTKVALTPGRESWSGVFNPVGPGRYRVRLEVTAAGQSVGDALTEFEVEQRDREADDALANIELLRQLAAVAGGTGGQYYDLADLSRLLQQLESRDYRRERKEISSTDFFDELRWPILLLVVLALAAEWTIRKRHGLP